jgi:hypothetical protein
MSVFPRLFLFYRVFGCFSAMGVQKHNKKCCTKKIVSKSFYKKFDQKSKTDFFSIFFDHVFGRFSMRGVQNTIKNIEQINLTLVLFRTLTHPPTPGFTDFFLPAPCCQPRAPDVPPCVSVSPHPHQAVATIDLRLYIATKTNPPERRAESPAGGGGVHLGRIIRPVPG